MTGILEYTPSFILGLITGIVSSWFVTVIFRRKDEEKEEKRYLHALNLYIGSMANKLYELLTQVVYNKGYEEILESIINTYENKPYHEVKHKQDSSQKKYMAEYYSVNEQVQSKINECRRLKRIIAEEDNPKLNNEIESLSNQRKIIAIELGILSGEFYKLLEKI